MSTVQPPLYTAIAKEWQLRNAEALIAAGADVNARDDKGRTVLDMASASLTSLESKKEARDDKGRCQQLVDLLKGHGAKPGEPTAKK